MAYSLEQGLKAQQALRKAADLPDEEFPVEAFIGMMSDEIQALREQGRSDEEITQLINAAADVNISTSTLIENYASPEDRHRD